jgi:hypothetical protein
MIFSTHGLGSVARHIVEQLVDILFVDCAKRSMQTITEVDSGSLV